MSKPDILIARGTVVDGTGADRRVADVAIAGGRIVAIGDLDRRSAERVIDADGLVVAPGFIDVHTHYDAQLHWDPYCTSSGWHGVTSVIVANCGFGFAPLPEELRERAMQMMLRTEQVQLAAMRAGLRWQWETFPDYLAALARLPKGVNVASYLPLNPLMIDVMGIDAAKRRRPTSDETSAMRRRLREAMASGAYGFSFSRMNGANNHTDFDGSPMPAELVPDETVLALAEELGSIGRGVIQTLERTEDPAKDMRVVERLAETAGRPVFHTPVVAFDHLPTAHRAVLDWLAACAERGLDVYGQSILNRTWMEFTLAEWNMYDFLPVWNRAAQGSTAERLARFSDPQVRAEMKAAENYDAVDWTMGVGGIEPLTVLDVRGDEDLRRYEGRSVGEIARAERRHPVDVFLDVACATRLEAEFRTGPGNSTDAKLVGELARHPRVVPGASDGGAHSKFFVGGQFTTEVLSWLVRDSGELTLEQAHHRLSALPAKLSGFADRGVLRVGAAADVVVYDLEALKAVPEARYETRFDLPAGEWRKVHRAEGYRWTIVNGDVTMIDGAPTGATPGVLLSPG
ncbi:MAG: N-acyl-D-amino-acid deacylase family protein [Candidatus Binatia bacterium]